jgi:CDP-diacylglycerol---serine O-phosphatidyltransferase
MNIEKDPGTPMFHGWLKRMVEFVLMRDRWITTRQLVPNFFTLLSICCALLAIRWSVEREFEWGMAAILASALLDGVDGRMARYMDAQSKFGEEFDSLADFVSFGVAPAILVFNWGLAQHDVMGWVAITLLALGCAVRLARFNAAIDRERMSFEKDYFMGVPAPAGAILAMLPLYLDGVRAAGDFRLGGLTHESWASWAAVGYIIMVAFLMVSTIPTFAGKVTLDRLGKNHPKVTLALLFGVTLLMFAYPYATLATGTLIYLLLMPLGVRKFLKLMKAYVDDDDDELSAATSGKAGE